MVPAGPGLRPDARRRDSLDINEGGANISLLCADLLRNLRIPHTVTVYSRTVSSVFSVSNTHGNLSQLSRKIPYPIMYRGTVFIYR